jgi:hypothetical protein
MINQQATVKYAIVIIWQNVVTYDKDYDGTRTNNIKLYKTDLKHRRVRQT